MLHGVERYAMAGEGLLEGELLPPECRSGGASGARRGDPFITPEKRMLAPRTTFCRLFGIGAQPDAAALIELGLAMETELPGDPSPDSSIPAGYTYFGQFVDHDINFDQTPLARTGAVDPTATTNNRTPSLDLDSLYGGGPEVRPELYEPDGATLRIGVCIVSKDAEGVEIPALPNDLLRVARKAVIGDPRNDENLILAQLHLAFLKFHNTFVAEFRDSFPSLPSHRLFQRAREATVTHYQRIVLRDFLPKIIDGNALQFVLSQGHRFFLPDQHAHMPIEFSVAAYRLGHSMIRPAYDWNKVFHSLPAPKLAEATLERLFEFTQFSGSTLPEDSPFFGLGDTLPSNWVADWRLMFEVDGAPPPAGFHVNRARAINTHLAFALKNLPEFLGGGVTDPALISLASRNLLRGRMVSLVDGLTAARAVASGGLPHDPLTEDQLRAGPVGPKLAEVGLLDTPPLWYYILREAELQDGERLGAVGSAIVAETIIAHIRNSEISVLSDPAVQSLFDIEHYSMEKMLLRVGDLNPIG
jgi:hypothetical protein